MTQRKVTKKFKMRKTVEVEKLSKRRKPSKLLEFLERTKAVQQESLSATLREVTEEGKANRKAIARFVDLIIHDEAFVGQTMAIAYGDKTIKIRIKKKK